MENSQISWCDHTQNFWIGCTKVSPGCANCYAETLDRNRFSKTLGGGTKDVPVCHWGPGAPRHRTSESIWNDPVRWNKIASNGWFRELYAEDGVTVIYRGDIRSKDVPHFENTRKCLDVRPRVFCSSLSDILDPEVAPKMLAEALDVIRKCDGLDWLLLTKRPELWSYQLTKALFFAKNIRPQMSALVSWIQDWINGNAPANIWFGTTVEDQPRADVRTPALLSIPARVRFLSAEPLLGPVTLTLGCRRDHNGDGNCDHHLNRCPRIHWVIVGGESGDKARPMHPAWARSIRDQCALAGVAFHFKQWGSWAPWVDEARYVAGKTTTESNAHVWMEPNGNTGACWIADDDGTWVNWSGNPPDSGSDGTLPARVAIFHRTGKKDAGRLLDGAIHDAFPVLTRDAEVTRA